MKKIVIILILFSGFWNSSYSQDIYYTRDAALFLNGQLDGEAIKAKTKKLGITLNYETTLITIRFLVNSLETGIDSIDNMLSKNTAEVIFEGKLGLEYVNTSDHPPLKFNTEGSLIINDSKSLIRGMGELHHIETSEQYACRLGLIMQLNLKELNIEPPISGLNDRFEVIITQALLQRDKN